MPTLYSEYVPILKQTMRAKPVTIERDLDTLHHWMNMPHVSEFWNMAWPKDKIKEYIEQCQKKAGFNIFIAFMDDEPMAYFELYEPATDVIGKHYSVQPGDIGLHVLIGEEKYQKRHIIRLSTMMMRLVFNAFTHVKRVMGEPDVDNKQVQGVMKFIGFKWIENITLPDKIGALHSLNKEDFVLAHGLNPPQQKPKAETNNATTNNATTKQTQGSHADVKQQSVPASTC